MINERRLISVLQKGLPLVSHPYESIAREINSTEDEVINYIQLMQNKGDIKRFGLVVRHRKLGYKANAMVVWDIPEQRVDALGQCFGQFDFVTLSYRRPRHLPDWPYNLFCMIHGQDKKDVMNNLSLMIQSCEVQDVNHELLFSTRCFKQRGAIYIHCNDDEDETKTDKVAV
ncbi:MAG: AsnC family protein [endosymbiont of Galathealinum brachiosum]|uniref:siroheme decarboxylase n=1 Tax=endosymbiont of Galathealinum brachiosum TaxID=2200906 RepID=A0A370DL83_9GAMM|nr:MAG: AsnC family protein [endosymbiont of Galathealinum brachiosum]